jgi:hypothetical protein
MCGHATILPPATSMSHDNKATIHNSGQKQNTAFQLMIFGAKEVSINLA